ncbi:MAG: hypothetical protein JWN38_51 [Candidatus Saccharibacteria bacterium]|nr:hypothetical protein [Candidatus Saccharibacteria bacterium]
MTAFLIILGSLLVLAAIAAPIVFMYIRKSFREQKNYERGLKIVPLIIHLPPPSDDVQVGGRDIRDVNEEVVSKAQIIYNIIASTWQKGFKGTFYGQRHFAFEIVGSKGFVYIYAAVPVSLVEVVKQAISSAYPTARLEEASEHNIFNPVGKATATLGGELTLKEPYAYPIATYQDLKRDAMQSLLTALSTLDKEDGAGIQILMRPANPSWRKTASAIASKKRKGNDKKLGGADLAKSILTAFNKPPESKKEDGGNKPDLSNMDQQVLDAIDDKTRHPGFEVLIRVVVSSNISARSQAILSNIVASFSLYDAPGKNGFKYTPAKDTTALATAYIMRFFPQQSKKTILNSVELATLFHFPDQRNIPTSQLTRQDSKQVDGPRNMPDDGMLLGYNVFRGAKKAIRLAIGDRQRHMYVVGQTGTGKSTFLENLALQDMLSGGGFAFVDPHGDTAEKLLSMVPKERTEDVIYFCPSDMDFPMGLNLFEFNLPEQKDFLVQEVLNMLYKLYDPQHQGIMGPRYEDMFRNAALAVMADPNGGTFVDIPQLFRDPAFLKEKLKHVTDKTVLDFWTKQFPAQQRSNESGEVTAWFVSKFGAFLSNEMMRNIIGQTKSAFDLRDIMDNKKILIVNLSKGRTGELNSKLLGMIFVMKFQAAAMSRSNIPEDDRVDFSLYVDEFQNFSTDSFATIMSEARKYHLNLIVANQFTTQLTQEIRDAVFGNMGTVVAFRIGQNDVESLGKYFQPTFESDDLLRVPNYNAIVRTLVGGVPTLPFSMASLPPLGSPNSQLGDALKQLSAAKYGRPKAAIEKEIFERFTIADEPAKPAFGAPASAAPAFANAGPAPAASPFQSAPTAGSTMASRAAAPAPAPAAPASFLDDWLNKRKAGLPTPNALAARPAPAPAPAPTPQPMPSPAPVATPTPAPSAAPAAATAPIAAPATPVNLAPTPVNMPAAGVTSFHSTGQLPAQPTGPDVFRPAEPASNAPQSTTPLTPGTPPEKAQNISSAELEKNEIDKIADELRQQLRDSQPAAAPTPAAPAPAAPKPQPVPVVARPVEDKPEIADGDTILIDKDGNFYTS